MPWAREVSKHRVGGRGPQDPGRLLAFVGAHAVPGVESWDGATYTRSLVLAGGPSVTAVTAREGGYDVTLRLTKAGDRDEALDRVRHLLAVDRDVSAAQQRLVEDPLLAPLVAARPGLRPPGSADHAETLVRTVIGQQVSLAGARALAARLVAAHGSRLPADWPGQAPGVTHLWPTAAVIGALSVTDPALAMPAARARTVVAVAGAVAAADELPSSEDLLALPGVGPWTCDYVSLRCRADPDVFLSGDLAVRRCLQRRGSATAPAAVASTARGWAPYRSLALMHLWADYLAL